MTMASIEVLQSPGSQARFVGGQAPPNLPQRKATSGGNTRLSPPLITRKPIIQKPTVVTQQQPSTTSALDIPRLIPEVKETSVVMSGLLEAYGLPPSPSGAAADSLTALGRPRGPRHTNRNNQQHPLVSPTHPKRHANSSGGQKVIVAVYQTSREHFAVVYPLRMMITARQPITTINLHKSHVVAIGPDSFRVDSTKEKKNGNQSTLTFKLLKNATVDLQCWMDAFSASSQAIQESSCRMLSRSPVMASYTPVMATLDESDGDEDGESQTC